MLLIEASSSSWSAVPVVPLDLTALYASYTSFLSMLNGGSGAWKDLSMSQFCRPFKLERSEF